MWCNEQPRPRGLWADLAPMPTLGMPDYDDVPVPAFGLRIVAPDAGIVGADGRPNRNDRQGCSGEGTGQSVEMGQEDTYTGCHAFASSFGPDSPLSAVIARCSSTLIFGCSSKAADLLAL